MNERMLKLYTQAQVPCTAIDPSNNMPYETTCFSADKFAELIVRECAGVAEGLSKLYPEKVGFDVGYTMGTARTAKDIKERFGVEE